MDTIGKRIETISKIFQKVMSVSSFDPEENLKSITAESSEYISVVYEAMAMKMAMEDISLRSGWANWRSFYNGNGKDHQAQIHVGLGWALAQSQLNLSSVPDFVSSFQKSRVYDGYGYYEGFFRKRKAITGQVLPYGINAEQLTGYDQGLGRSIWYNSAGNLSKAYEVITGFSNERKGDLWRGLSMACAYVGGADKEILKNLAQLSGKYFGQVQTGIVLIAESRNNAKTITKSVELACKTLCNCSVEEAIRTLRKLVV